MFNSSYLPGGFHSDFRRSDEPFYRPGGSGAAVILYIGITKQAWSSGAADADIYSVDGATMTDTGIDAPIYDPLGMFASLGSGAEYWVIKQQGKYYAINAVCPDV